MGGDFRQRLEHDRRRGLSEDARHDLQRRQPENRDAGVDRCRILSLAGTFCYSEVAALMPEAGGDYVYLRRAYGRIVGYLFGWMAFAVFRTGSQAALAVGFAIFMNVALGGGLERWHIGGLHILGLHAASGRDDPRRRRDIWLVATHQLRERVDRRTHRARRHRREARARDRRGCRRFLARARRFQSFRRIGTRRHLRGRGSERARRYRGFRRRDARRSMGVRGLDNVAPLAGEIRDPQRNLPRVFIGGTLVVAVLYYS